MKVSQIPEGTTKFAPEDNMTQIQYATAKRNQSFKPVKPHDFKVADLVIMCKITHQKLSRRNTRTATELLNF